MNSFRCIFQVFCLFSKNTYIKEQLSSVFCELNCSLHLGCFLHISRFCVLPPKIPISGPSRLTENMRRNALCEKKTIDVKKKQLKKFSSKIYDTFLVLKNRSKSKFKEKNSNSVWCEQCIFA